jgi:cytochrome c-type biogenesis protein CcmH
MKRVLVLTTVLALGLAAPAAASERDPTLPELEGELICPTCKTTLDQSSAPVADQMRRIVRERIRAGDTKSEIKARLVRNYGPGVLAAPRKSGFDLVAWLLPLLGIVGAAVVVGVSAWRWTRPREDADERGLPEHNGQVRLEPELERRLDEELARFD